MAPPTATPIAPTISAPRCVTSAWSPGRRRAFNLFMWADVAADGSLSFRPPPSRPGEGTTFRAEMDLAVALSACPAATCNGGREPGPLAFEILPPA